MDQVYARISLHANKAISNKEIWREEKPACASSPCPRKELAREAIKMEEWRIGKWEVTIIVNARTIKSKYVIKYVRFKCN